MNNININFFFVDYDSENLLKKLTEPIRLYSFIALMVLLFLFYIIGQNYFIGYFTIACAIWYFLSFFSKGQDICKNLLSSCFKRGNYSKDESWL